MHAECSGGTGGKTHVIYAAATLGHGPAETWEQKVQITS